MIHIYTDGACLGNPGPGGWAALIIEGGLERSVHGRVDSTTNNRMELLAAINGLRAIPARSATTVFSDSRYLVDTMAGKLRRSANLDLWMSLDELAASRDIHWEWVRGHSGNPGNEEANNLATWEASQVKAEKESRQPNLLTHVDERGMARQVDVGGKLVTRRTAVAKGNISMEGETLRLIQEGGLEKGDVFAVARIAGVMGAKRVADIIPLCHPLPLDQVKVEFDVDEMKRVINITSTVRATTRTGVEMEALSAVMAAALTIYDMGKAVDRRMQIGDVRLVYKSGGKDGEIYLADD